MQKPAGGLESPGQPQRQPLRVIGGGGGGVNEKHPPLPNAGRLGGDHGSQVFRDGDEPLLAQLVQGVADGIFGGIEAFAQLRHGRKHPAGAVASVRHLLPNRLGYFPRFRMPHDFSPDVKLPGVILGAYMSSFDNPPKETVR